MGTAPQNARDVRDDDDDGPTGRRIRTAPRSNSRALPSSDDDDDGGAANGG